MMKRTTYYAAAGCTKGLGDTAGVTCKFSRHNPPNEATKRMQAMLIAAGASQVKVDGYWGPCTESAYQKIFGEPLSKESLAKLGITCSSFTKVADGTCTDGSDTVTPIGGGGQTTAPPTSMQSLPFKLAPSKTPILASKTPFKPISSIYKMPTTASNVASPSQQTMIPGVPNLYVTIGGLALLGVAGWFAYGAMSGGGKVKRNAGKPTLRAARAAIRARQSAHGDVIDDLELLDRLTAAGNAFEYMAKSDPKVRGLIYYIAADPTVEFVDESSKVYTLRSVKQPAWGSKRFTYYNVSKVPFLRK